MFKRYLLKGKKKKYKLADFAGEIVRNYVFYVTYILLSLMMANKQTVK